VTYQDELNRLTREYIRLSPIPGTGPTLLKNVAATADLEKKIGELLDLKPCPEPSRAAVPPANLWEALARADATTLSR
jgi:hypothetical protein